MRKRLGGIFFGGIMLVSGSTGVRSTVYDLGDRLEIEERDHWMISRRRIPLRDVVLITNHRYRRTGTAIAFLIIVLIFSAMGTFIGGINDNYGPGLLAGLICASPFLIAAIWFFSIQILEIQVQSRRVTACMRFGIRKHLGETIAADLEARIKAAQFITPKL